MGVLSFDGTNDRITSTSLAAGLASLATSGWTMACLIRRGSATTQDAICYLHSSPATEAGLSIDPSDDLMIDISGVGGPTLVAAFTDTTNAYMIVITHPPGLTQTSQYSYKLNSGGAWTSGNMTGTLSDQASCNGYEIGSWEAGDFFIGHIGLIGWWSGAMSQANREALDDNWRTSDWYNSAHGTPVSLIEFNTLTPTDIGSAPASSLTLSGPTLDAAQTLNSWNFNGTGAAATKSLIWQPAQSSLYKR